MKYEVICKEIHALPIGSITLQFVSNRQRRCEQVKWNSAGVKLLSDLSFDYFVKHGYKCSVYTSYWVDIHGDVLAIKIEARNTKLRPDRAVQYRTLLRRFADKSTRVVNGKSSRPKLPRGLVRSLNRNQTVIPTESTSEFYIPLVQVDFIAVPSSFYLTHSMSSEERQRISRQLPENCSVKIPLTPFPAVKVQARGKGEHFIGMLSDEECVALYMTMDEAERRAVIWKNGETCTVYPPLAMREIINHINKPTSHFNIGTSQSLPEQELIFGLLSVIREQNQTSFNLLSLPLVPQTPPGSPPPESRVDPKVEQNWEWPSTPPGFKSLRHFAAYSGTEFFSTAKSSSPFEPTIPPSEQLSDGEKNEIKRYRPLLLSKDFASHAGKIWIIALPIQDKQKVKLGAKFSLSLPIYSSSAKPEFISVSEAFKFSFEDLLSIKEILTPDCFLMTPFRSHKHLDNTPTQINTLVRIILYTLVSSNIGSEVPLSPEERRILGYRPTYVLRSIEYYTVDSISAMIWISIFCREIRLSLFRSGKARINENLAYFKKLRDVFHCCSRNLLLSGQTIGENYRNSEVLEALLRPSCHSPCNRRTGAVPSPPPPSSPHQKRAIPVKLSNKGGFVLNEYQSTHSDTESAPPDSLQKTPPHSANSRPPTHWDSFQSEELRPQSPWFRFSDFRMKFPYNRSAASLK